MTLLEELVDENQGLECLDLVGKDGLGAQAVPHRQTRVVVPSVDDTLCGLHQWTSRGMVANRKSSPNTAIVRTHCAHASALKCVVSLTEEVHSVALLTRGRLLWTCCLLNVETELVLGLLLVDWTGGLVACSSWTPTAVRFVTLVIVLASSTAEPAGVSYSTVTGQWAYMVGRGGEGCGC